MKKPKWSNWITKLKSWRKKWGIFLILFLSAKTSKCSFWDKGAVGTGLIHVPILNLLLHPSLLWVLVISVLARREGCVPSAVSTFAERRCWEGISVSYNERKVYEIPIRNVHLYLKHWGLSNSMTTIFFWFFCVRRSKFHTVMSYIPTLLIPVMS